MNLYIFSGQFGSGKTSMARIVAMAANCMEPEEDGSPCCTCEKCRTIMSGVCQDYMELDAASRTGVDDVRGIIEDVSYTPVFLKKKIYIIDEIQMLSKSAFNSLLKTLEEPPAYAIFMLCTTELKSIPATVQSRAARFTFSQISDDDIFIHLKKVAERHGMDAEDASLGLIAKNSDGAMRNALSLLEQANAISESGITEKDVQEMLGVTDCGTVFGLMGSICRAQTVEVATKVNEILSAGKDVSCLCDDMLSVVTDGIIYSCGRDDALIANTEEYCRQIHLLVEASSREQLCWLSQQILDIRDSIKKGGSRSVFLVNLIRMANQGAAQNQDMLLERIEKLEHAISGLLDGNTYIPQSQMNCPCGTDGQSAEIERGSSACMPDGNYIDGTEAYACVPAPESVGDNLQSGNTGEPCGVTVSDIYSLFDAPDMIFRDEPVALVDSAGIDDDRGPCMTDELARQMEETEKKVEELCMEDAALFSAIHEGAVFSVDGSIIVYRTPLEPLVRMLNAYFEAYGIKAVAQFDASVEL